MSYVSKGTPSDPGYLVRHGSLNLKHTRPGEGRCPVNTTCKQASRQNSGSQPCHINTGKASALLTVLVCLSFLVPQLATATRSIFDSPFFAIVWLHPLLRSTTPHASIRHDLWFHSMTPRVRIVNRVNAIETSPVCFQHPAHVCVIARSWTAFQSRVNSTISPRCAPPPPHQSWT
jgi:hypothetical protein